MSKINIINPTGINEIAKRSFKIAQQRGQLNKPYLESLIEEVNEVIEEENKNLTQSEPSASEHLPNYTGVQEELADVILVAMTTLYGEGVNIEQLLIEKTKYNEQRS